MVNFFFGLPLFFGSHLTSSACGFLYSYLYPGMNKVQQAAGRVIRTEKDTGVIALLDERFLGKQYQETFPREWSTYDRCGLTTVSDKIQEFYRKREEEC